MQLQQKITLGEMRESGPTRLIVYCADYKCGHSVLVDASRWGDDVRLSDLERDLRVEFAAIGCRHPAFVRACPQGDRLTPGIEFL
jgi:hypothetical protein